jgi:hypothetical protein
MSERSAIQFLSKSFSRGNRALTSNLDQVFSKKVQGPRPGDLVRLCVVSRCVMSVHECVISGGIGKKLMGFAVLRQLDIEPVHIL